MKVKTLLIAIAVIGVAGGGFAYYKHVDNMKIEYEKQLAEKDGVINELQTQINYTGELTRVYELVGDVSGGTEINAEDLSEVEVPTKMASNCITDLSEIEGMYYLYDLKEGQVLTYNQILDFGIEDNMRLLDIQFDQIPIGIQIGDYVDVKISFTMGQDFVGMTHKRVVAVNENNIMKLVVDPKDMHVYESMKVDKGLYDGTIIYAAQYVDGAAQVSSSDYYPVRLETMTTLLQDPNITMDFSSLSTADRTILESELNTSEKAMKTIMSQVNTAKSSMETAYKNSLGSYNRAVQKAQQEAKKAQEKAAKEAAKQAAKDAASTSE